MEKRVLVDAYLENNLGDDLFIKILLERYPSVQFDFVNSVDSKILDRYNNAHSVEMKLVRFFRRDYISSYISYIIIGGSMFQQKGKWLKLYISRLLKNIMLKRSHTNIQYLGFNFGPVKTKLFLKLYKILFLKTVDNISIRDQFSKDTLGIGSLYKDIVFSLDTDQFLNKKVPNSIGITVMNFRDDVEKTKLYTKKIVDFINQVPSNYKVNIYGFQSDGKINDSTVIQEILARTKGKVNAKQYIGDINEFLTDYFSNEFYITTRFHSLVLALLVQGNVRIMSYADKVENLVNDLNIQQNLINIEKDNLTSEIFNKSGTTNINLKELKNDAEKHFNKLDRILG